LILRLTCPVCNRDAYNSSVEFFGPCPYCGILFSGKYGTDKRREVRVQKEIAFGFTYKGRFLRGSTINISEGGLCIKVYGRISISPGEILNLDLGGSIVSARTAWAFHHPDGLITMMGLQMLDAKSSLLRS
jgi:hypothetical protein